MPGNRSETVGQGDSSPTKWIHELAQCEFHPDAEKVLNLGRSLDPMRLVEESAVGFMGEIRASLAEYTRLFNGYSDSGNRFQEIKLYSIAGSSADFMLFRNLVKLVFSNPSHGSIQIAFVHHVQGGAVSASTMNGAYAAVAGAGGPWEIQARVNPLREVQWMLGGEAIEPDSVARFFFAEFVRTTRDSGRSRAGNQQLIDGIRALLQERGITL